MKKYMLTPLLLLTGVLTGCLTEEFRPAKPAEQNENPGSGAKTLRLSFYSDFFEDPERGFVPQQKVKFDYTDNGQLIQKTIYGFDANQALTALNYFTFTYQDNRVATITGYLTGTDKPNVKYAYTYQADGNVSTIHETNYAAGITSTVSFLYNSVNNKTRATYTFSNGGSFSYDFFTNSGNVVSDKTVKGADLCNVGSYTYDAGINPLSQLGYVEYNLTNYSTNNRVSENVNYTGCAFPTFVPVQHTYVYNTLGYPIVAITTYKSGSRTGRSQRIFSYR